MKNKRVAELSPLLKGRSWRINDWRTDPKRESELSLNPTPSDLKQVEALSFNVLKFKVVGVADYLYFHPCCWNLLPTPHKFTFLSQCIYWYWKFTIGDDDSGTCTSLGGGWSLRPLWPWCPPGDDNNTLCMHSLHSTNVNWVKCNVGSYKCPDAPDNFRDGLEMDMG